MDIVNDKDDFRKFFEKVNKIINGKIFCDDCKSFIVNFIFL